MRGGSQAHLLECSDSQCYVVKFSNNPQDRRTLINEWIGSAVLNYLGISTPPTAAINVSADFLAEHPEVFLELHRGRQRIEPGWHFGSQLSVSRMSATYDFIPDALFDKVENINDFRGTLAFDKWLGNADSRQAIFFKRPLPEAIHSSEPKILKPFRAQMIDNGHVFQGSIWRFAVSPIQGLYFRPQVYNGVSSLENFEPWLNLIIDFPQRVKCVLLAGEP